MQVGLLGIALLASPPEPPPEPLDDVVDVRWSAPESCPDRARFIESVEELVGHRLRMSPDAETFIDGRVASDPQGHVLRLEMRTRDEQIVRELRGARCDELTMAGALAVVAHLSTADTGSSVPVVQQSRELVEATVHPEASADEAAADEAAADEAVIDGATAELDVLAPSPPPSSSPPAFVPAPAPASAPARTVVRVQGALVVMGGGELGATPQPTGAFRGALALRMPRARAELRAHHALATSTSGTDDIAVRISLTRGELVGCGVLARGSVDVPVCAGFALGAVLGAAEGSVNTSRTRRQFWIGLPVDVGVGWAPLRWLALRATLGGVISLRRPAFHVAADSGPVAPFRVPVAGGVVLGGVEFRWP